MSAVPLRKRDLPDLADVVLPAWRQGHDTYAIARSLRVSESAVYRIIAAEQDRRYAERSAASTAEAAHA